MEFSCNADFHHCLVVHVGAGRIGVGAGGVCYAEVYAEVWLALHGIILQSASVCGKLSAVGYALVCFHAALVYVVS